MLNSMNCLKQSIEYQKKFNEYSQPIMAITKKPTVPAPTPAVDKFIESAPDGAKAKTANEEKDGVQITLRMSKSQLERINSIAKRQGIPRASYIKRAVFIQLDTDEKS